MLRLQVADDHQGLAMAPGRLVVAGYTGRDQAAVDAHIDELAAIGVPPPPSVPAFYELDPALVTTEEAVEVRGAATSGEVEPVLVRHRGRWFLGVGSDHTDRDLERQDIVAAKAACPKPLAPAVLALPGGLDALDWDAVEVWAQVDGEDYQRGTLAALRRPLELLARLTEHAGEDGADLVVYAGTLPLLGGHFRPGTAWRVGLRTVEGQELAHAYAVTARPRE
ncbi:MAG TPA: DUF2848 family protein [Acidimicrobiales bacterium]|nr:DUF2848 family protein [Acidimicrobiales bacterium]